MGGSSRSTTHFFVLGSLCIFMVGSLALHGCSAGGGRGATDITRILTPQNQSESGQGAATAGANNLNGDQPEVAPNRKPAVTGSENTIEMALVPSQSPPASQQVTENLARSSASAPQNSTSSRQKSKDTAVGASRSTSSPVIASGGGTKKSGGFLSGLFQSSRTSKVEVNNSRSATTRTRTRTAARSAPLWDNGSLPGVRKGKEIYGIDIEEMHEMDDGIQLASVTNRARRGDHGLLLQREDVKVGCFPQQLVRILKSVERRFGRSPVITSGYRSRSYNKMVRGAKNSMHIHCKAADIQVKGVSKHSLARYLRSLPGRGGVGTYCHTRSVHIDVGRKRDWDRPCKRRRTRKT